MDEVFNKIIKNYDLLKLLYEHYQNDWRYDSSRSQISVNKKDEQGNDIPDELDTKIIWNRSLIEKYSNYFDWYLLSQNNSIPWDEYLFDKFSYKLDTKEWINICKNPLIKWNKRLLNKYWDKILVNVIISYSPIFWSEELVRFVISKHLKAETKIFWLDKFSVISNIEWTLKMIIDFPTSSWLSRVISGKSLKYSFEILRTHKEELTKDVFVYFQYSDTLIWSQYWIKVFKELINFDSLSNSTNVVWSDDLISNFKDELNFNNLSNNNSIKFSDKLISKHQEKWDFKLLSKHPNIQFSEGLIKKFENRWDFNELSKNSNIKFSEALIKKFENKWDFKELSYNESVKWNLNLIRTYIDKIDLNIVLQSPIDGIDETFIDEYKDYIKWKSDSHDYTDGYEAVPISSCNHLKIPVKVLLDKATRWKSGPSNTGYWSKQRWPEPGEWHLFSSNWFLSYDHLMEFQYVISWDIISSNEHLKLTEEIINEFNFELNWTNIINRSNFNLDDFFLIQKYLSVEFLNEYKGKIITLLKDDKDTVVNLFESEFERYDIFRYNGLREIRRMGLKSEYERKKSDFLNNANREFAEKLCEEAVLNLPNIKKNSFEDSQYKILQWLRDNFELFDDLSYVTKDFEREVSMSYVHNNTVRNFVYTYLEYENKYKRNVFN